MLRRNQRSGYSAVNPLNKTRHVTHLSVRSIDGAEKNRILDRSIDSHSWFFTSRAYVRRDRINNCVPVCAYVREPRDVAMGMTLFRVANTSFDNILHLSDNSRDNSLVTSTVQDNKITCLKRTDSNNC